jgi:hypothetical protein
MSEFNVNVNVSIGLTPELTKLIQEKLTRNKFYEIADYLDGAKEKAEASESLPQRDEAPKPIRRKKPNPVKGFAEGTSVDDASSASEAEVKEDLEPEPAKKDEPIKAPDVSDVRAAMHRTRCRIEGEDYKENVDGEGHKKYHKLLTAAFTNLSALLGADKPSGLEEDKRQAFIDKCEELIVDANGDLITNKAPY